MSLANLVHLIMSCHSREIRVESNFHYDISTIGHPVPVLSPELPNKQSESCFAISETRQL